MIAARRPKRYVRRAAGLFAIAVAGIVSGTVASAHHMDSLSELAAGVVGITLGLAIGMLGRAFVTGHRIPRRAQQLAAMSQAMDAGQPVSGNFEAGLRDLVPPRGAPPTRWKHGRVIITPQSIVWMGRITGRARDLTGAQCIGDRRPEPAFSEVTLRLPSDYRGENVRIIKLHADGADIELAAPARLLGIILYSLARITRGAP
jgi:hypothetical protein